MKVSLKQTALRVIEVPIKTLQIGRQPLTMKTLQQLENKSPLVLKGTMRKSVRTLGLVNYFWDNSSYLPKEKHFSLWGHLLYLEGGKIYRFVLPTHVGQLPQFKKTFKDVFGDYGDPIGHFTDWQSGMRSLPDKTKVGEAQKLARLFQTYRETLKGLGKLDEIFIAR